MCPLEAEKPARRFAKRMMPPAQPFDVEMGQAQPPANLPQQVDPEVLRRQLLDAPARITVREMRSLRRELAWVHFSIFCVWIYILTISILKIVGAYI